MDEWINKRVVQQLFRYMCVITISFLTVACSKDEETETPEISLNKNELFLEEGSSERLVANFNPSGTNLEAHSWKSTNTDIASVDETGMVTGIKEGNTTIAVIALNGGSSATCNVTVLKKKIKITGFSLNVKDTTLIVGENLQLETTISPDDATDKTVSWNTSNDQIATVSAEGVVTAQKVGKVIITAATNDGDYRDTANIAIVNSPIDASSIEITETTSTSVSLKGEVAVMWGEYDEIGLCYSTEHSPTVEDKTMRLYSLSVNRAITTLECNTTYYVRFYIEKDNTVYYSKEFSATTNPLVGFSVPEISYLSVNSAVISGSIDVDDSSVEKGICFSTSPDVKIENGEVIKLVENDFLHKIENLQSGTTYYLKLYAIIEGATHYGEEFSFTTKSGAVIVPYCIQLTSISIGIEGDEETLNTISGVCYSKFPNPTINDMKMVKSSSEYLATSLSSGTDYYVRAYSTINGETIYYDECKIQTVGETMSKSFGIVHTFFNFMSVGGEAYAVYLIDYNIEEKGVYDVSPFPVGGRNCGDFIMGGRSDGQTIPSGRGTFYLYLKRDSNVLTKRSRQINFINQTTGVKYIFYNGEIIEEYN